MLLCPDLFRVSLAESKTSRSSCTARGWQLLRVPRAPKIPPSGNRHRQTIVDRLRPFRLVAFHIPGSIPGASLTRRRTRDLVEGNHSHWATPCPTDQGFYSPRREYDRLWPTTVCGIFLLRFICSDGCQDRGEKRRSSICLFRLRKGRSQAVCCTANCIPEVVLPTIARAKLTGPSTSRKWYCLPSSPAQLTGTEPVIRETTHLSRLVWLSFGWPSRGPMPRLRATPVPTAPPSPAGCCRARDCLRAPPRLEWTQPDRPRVSEFSVSIDSKE